MTDPLAGRMRWWGWGVDGHDAPLPEAAAALLRRELGAGGARVAPPALERIDLPEPALPAGARARLVEAVGGGYVRDDRLARITHAAGRSYPDLVRLRSGRGLAAPDAIVLPAGHDEVAAVLAVCAEEAVAVIPATRSRVPARRSATTTPSAPTMRRGWRRRWASSAWPRCGPSRRGSIRPAS